MSADILCHPYVWEDPRYLFHTLWSKSKSEPCASEVANRIVLVYLIAIVLGFLASTFVSVQGLPLLAGIIATILLLPTFQDLRGLHAKRLQMKHGADSLDEQPGSFASEKKEGFQDLVKDFVAPSNLRVRTFNNTGVDGAPLGLLTTAKDRNPFNNVLIDQIKYEPNRPAAEDITSTEKKIELDDLFRVQWYSDPTDVFGKTQSQRMFITQPVTTIPNDQDSYQKWLYKIPGKSCKEGGAENCYAGTEGAALPWLNM